MLKAPIQTVRDIENDLDTLEDILEPLLAHPLEDTLANLSVINKAKLQTLIPYVVHDLIISYLKVRGVDVRSHGVMSEMERVKKYFDKIKNAEDPSKNKLAVDKEAASRFIKNAIATATRAPLPPPPTVQSSSTSTHIRFSDSNASVQVTAANMTSAAAQKIKDRQLAAEERDEESDDSDEMEITEGALAGPPKSTKGKGRATEAPEVQSSKNPTSKGTSPNTLTNTGSGNAGVKRRRAAIDPFAGYDIGSTPGVSTSSPGSSNRGTPTPTSASENASEAEDSSASGAKPKKKRRRVRDKKKKASGLSEEVMKEG
ncbi:hypothetical protein SISNIDRAFT_487249 [Sistotremastrum niveocremeum HHB9708]|uniref:Exosome complex protein n=1 Tax=Sistotremastrum niveocremeum HHB9708 TaxID=1314777 RepID=A0A164SKM1_9AGAM|nr:hypothetical protein SISNIDRAFT_487249 [Sistotremastrum niveocremeum HHB9708]